MRKREQGVLTIEASIVLTLMLLFILFLFSFGRVYRAQNMISHAALQSADAVALESYLRETALQSDVSDVVNLATHITDSTAISAENLESLRSANVPKIAKEKFITAIASSEADADEKLKRLGVKGGISGVDFSECKMDLTNDDVIIAVKYTIEMQFPVMGFSEITVTKAAKAKTFGDILFEVSTAPNQPGWGTTSGDDKVTHGSNVQIIAKPNYGYKFVMWSDGSTENPRNVTVTDAQHYIAIFEKDSFGINLSKTIKYNTSYAGIAHSSYGTVSGAGNYLYMDNAIISATPAENYDFVGWDDNGDGTIDNTSSTRTITIDKTYTIKAVFKPALKTVTVRSNNSDYGTAQVRQGGNTGNSIQVEYGSIIQLIASSKDSVKYAFSKWSNNDTQTSVTITVMENIEYEAFFERNTYTVRFYNGDTHIYTTTVIRGSSIASSRNISGSSMPTSNPTKSDATFDIWKYNGTKFDSSTKVHSDINVYATWKYTVTFDANGGLVSGATTKSITVSNGGSFDFSSIIPQRNGYSFNGWYRDNTKYVGNKSITSNITVTASWTCNHTYRYESSRTGTICEGGTIYYNCSTCGADMGTGKYSGSHSYWFRCDQAHKFNSFNGLSGCGGYHERNKWCSTCGVTHGSKVYGYCIVCANCFKAMSGTMWCGNEHCGYTRTQRPYHAPSNGHQW